jgi:hypothetical protein
VKQRALDLAVLLGGHLASLGPSARGLSINLLTSWTMIRIAVDDDIALRALAEDFGLDPARTERRGRAWFRQASARADGLIIIAAGPVHSGPMPETP